MEIILLDTSVCFEDVIKKSLKSLLALKFQSNSLNSLKTYNNYNLNVVSC